MSTTDVERSVRFYREVLGFKVLWPGIFRIDAFAGPGFTAKARLLDTESAGERRRSLDAFWQVEVLKKAYGNRQARPGLVLVA
jgi:catechol 2,3-dioxygenase-like lactoylglutathione lyase family enzyme